MKHDSSPTDFRIRKILHTIESDPSVELESLAAMAGLSISRLSHLFKAQAGMSINSFLATVRLEKAAELLISTEMRIKEITYTVGYSHASSFDRAFRKRFNISPNSYRNQQRLYEIADPAREG